MLLNYTAENVIFSDWYLPQATRTDTLRTNVIALVMFNS